MSDNIVNRVAKSNLKTIDLEELYPEGERKVLDIKDWLFEELILKEKDFRQYVEQHDWTQYKNAFVAVICSVDAIVPSWAFMLVASSLSEHAHKAVIGNLETLETVLYQELLEQLDYSEFIDAPVIIKGCANKPIPLAAYSLLIEKIQPVSSNIMFGEACSTVPIFKKKRV